jgi:16S rRNA (guanine1207-N2)-methyltransferase
MTAVRSTEITSLLLAESVSVLDTDRLLLISDDPALADAFAKRAASVDIYHESSSALARYRTCLQAWRLTNVHLYESVFPAPGLDYDLALVVMPKGREYARALLWAAYGALRAGGKLYVCGANDGGIRAILSDAETLFGRNVTISTKQRHRVGVSIRPEADRDYPAAWGDNPTLVQVRPFATPFGMFPMATMPGVFSWEHLDDGTQLLLETVQRYGKIAAGESVLDIGCGNGIIGVSVATTARRVLMTDESLLAVRCAQESVRLNALTNAEVRTADVYSGVEERFDAILANPPFHRQIEVTTGVAQEIIRGAAAHLTPGGRLIIVANAFLGYERLMEQQHLSAVEKLALTNRYVVLQGIAE